MSTIDLASNSALLSVADKLDTQNSLLTLLAGGEGSGAVTDWATVQKYVRAGLAPNFFSVGDQLICNHGEYGELVWDIIGIDADTPADSTKTHSLTLMLHEILPIRMTFSDREAMYMCSGLEAGTYYFTMPNYSDSSSKSFYFTTTQYHSSPTMFFFDNSTKKIIIYSDPLYTSIVETVTATVGSQGTFLGRTDGTSLNKTANILYGTTDWKRSDIRQWLNSDMPSEQWSVYSEAAGAFHLPSSKKSYAGFLNQIDPDFKAVLGKVLKKTCLHGTSNSSFDTTEDMVFLPAITEVYGSTSKSGNEGAAYDYFGLHSDLSAPGDGADLHRIKYQMNALPYDSGSSYLLRSNDTDDTINYIWSVNYDGYINTRCYANYDSYIAPVCCIV